MAIATLKRRSQFLAVRGGVRWSGPAFVLEAKQRASPAHGPGDTHRDAGPSSDTGPSSAVGTVATAAANLAGTGPAGTGDGEPRFGFTVTKKIGNAVVRNRVRRRFREALRTMPGGAGQSGFDYVLVARDGATAIAFADLQAALATALVHVHRRRASRGPDRAPKRPT